MAGISPISRSDLIRRLKKLGFEGPYSGGRHEFMLRENKRLILPNPHRKDIGKDLLARILKQAKITIEEWSGS